MKNQMQLLLDRFANGELDAAEAKRLEEAMAADPELRKEARRQVELQKLMNSRHHSFGYFFAEKTMARIELQKPAGINRSIDYAFRRIALPGLAAALIILLVTLFSNGSMSLDSLMGVEPLQPEYLADFLLYNY
ncbi:MAG: hypothetical protein ACLFPE_08815 [Bacteroidales bacterium]